jgi:hypothetical protein
MTLSSYESVVVYHVSLLAHNHCLIDHCLIVLYQHLSLWSCCSLSVVHMSFTVLNACTTTLCHVRGLVVIMSVVVCILSVRVVVWSSIIVFCLVLLSCTVLFLYISLLPLCFTF